MITEKQIWAYGIAVLLIVFAAGMLYNYYNPPINSNKYEFPSPEKTVRNYLEAWRDKRYADMYSVISDEFKKTEPNAESLAKFREHIEKQGIKVAEILEVAGVANDEKKTSVKYKIVFENARGEKMPFEGIFSLGFMEKDLVKGWKLAPLDKMQDIG